MNKPSPRLKPLVFGCLAAIYYTPANAGINNFGATGLYNIPNADVSQLGDLNWGYNNFLAGGDVRDSNTLGENALFNFGVFPNLEVNFRLLHLYDKNHQSDVYGDFYKRDLSGNAKFKLPFISNAQTRFAIGTTDIGGLAVNFRRHYGVVSHQFGNFDVTAGYAVTGNAETNRSAVDALDGFFAGVEYQPVDWLKASVEQESSGERAGVDLFWHQPFGYNLSLQAGAMLASTTENEDPSIRVGISFPLGGKVAGSDMIETHTPTKPMGSLDKQRLPNQQMDAFNPTLASQAPLQPSSALESGSPNVTAGTTAEVTRTSKTSKTPPIPTDMAQSSTQAAQRVVRALEQAGLDFIHVGQGDENHLIVAYENRLYNHSSLDALAAALNALGYAKLPENIQTIDLYTLEKGQAKLKTSVSVSNLIQLTQGNYSHNKLGAWLSHDIVSFLPKVRWQNTPKRQSRVNLELNLAYKAYYGTEYANWDYSMALNPIARIPLWQGAELSGSYTTDSINSYGFDEGAFNDSQITSNLVEVMAHQTLPLFKGASTTLSVGKVKLGDNDYQLWTNQGSYRPLDGNAKLYWYHGKASSQASNGADYDFRVVGGEYTIQSVNLTLGANTGKYALEDRSTNYYATTRFGSSTARVSYVTSDIGWDRVDFSVSFPLAFRKAFAAGPATFSGNNDFSTGIRTTIDNPVKSNMNLVSSNSGYVNVGSVVSHSQSSHANYDNGKLTPSYLNTHRKQLLESLLYTR